MRLILFVLLVVALEACATVAPCDQPWRRRSFTELDPITVVSEGVPWQVEPRTYSQKDGDRGETHWVALTLRRPGSTEEQPFFKYRYGDESAQYWVYVLHVCDSNADGRQDLTFYAGDDTTDVRVEFVNTGSDLRETKRTMTEGE